MGQAVFKRIQFVCNYFRNKASLWQGALLGGGKWPTAPTTHVEHDYLCYLSRLSLLKNKHSALLQKECLF